MDEKYFNWLLIACIPTVLGWIAFAFGLYGLAIILFIIGIAMKIGLIVVEVRRVNGRRDPR